MYLKYAMPYLRIFAIALMSHSLSNLYWERFKCIFCANKHEKGKKNNLCVFAYLHLRFFVHILLIYCCCCTFLANFLEFTIKLDNWREKHTTNILYHFDISWKKKWKQTHNEHIVLNRSLDRSMGMVQCVCGILKILCFVFLYGKLPYLMHKIGFNREIFEQFNLRIFLAHFLLKNGTDAFDRLFWLLASTPGHRRQRRRR